MEIGESIDEGIVADYFHEVHPATENFFCFRIITKEAETEREEGEKKQRMRKEGRKEEQR